MFRIMGRVLYGLSLSSVAISLVLWLQNQRQPKGLAGLLWRPNYASAERTGIFVGLWAPTLAILGKAMEDMQVKISSGKFQQNGASTDQQANTSAWERVPSGTANRS